MSHRTNVMVTREGWYYLGMLAFIIAGASIRDINLLYIMAGMMLGPLLFSYLAATRSLRRLHVTRRFQSLVGFGDPLYVEIITEKPKGTPQAFAAIVQDQILREGDHRSMAVNAQLFFAQIPAGGTAEGAFQVRLKRRGRYCLGTMKVSTRMPLGLLRATTNGCPNDWVLVSPQLGTLLLAWSRHLKLTNEGGQNSVRRRGKAEGDFYGMREWRDGDSRNWIHWRTSAKQNKLTVRQFEQRVSQDLVVILDLWHPAASTSSREIELAVSFAATLVVHHGKKGSSQLLVASASESGFVLQGNSSPVFRQELLERFAIVDVTTTDTLPMVLAKVLPKATANAKVVLVSPCERDLNDTDLFESIWNQRDMRRSLNDVVKVNTASEKFSDWFRLDSGSQAGELTTVDTSEPVQWQEPLPK